MVDNQVGLLNRSCTILKSSNPLHRHVFLLVLGVRDAQSSDDRRQRCQALFMDSDSNLFKWMKQLKKKPIHLLWRQQHKRPRLKQSLDLECLPMTLSLEIHPAVLSSIRRGTSTSFLSWAFLPEHSAVFQSWHGKQEPSFDDSDFFSDDPIHLTDRGS